jgi:hypothetical protein
VADRLVCESVDDRPWKEQDACVRGVSAHGDVVGDGVESVPIRSSHGPGFGIKV